MTDREGSNLGGACAEKKGGRPSCSPQNLLLNVQILHAAQIRDSTLFDKQGEPEDDQGQKQESDIGPKMGLHVCVQRLRRSLVTGFRLWISHLVESPDPIQLQDDQQKKRDRTSQGQRAELGVRPRGADENGNRRDALQTR